MRQTADSAKSGNAFTGVYAIVRSIPAGSVYSYGGIARALGNPRLSRIVGCALRACNEDDVPCHRVVHQDGRLAESFGAAGNDLQRALLTEEGVRFLPDGRVDMAQCAWHG